MNEQPHRSHEVYSICVRSIIDEGWVRALDVKPLETHRHYTDPARTVLTLELADQSELLGLLFRLHSLGLTVLSLEKRPPATDQRPTNTQGAPSWTERH